MCCQSSRESFTHDGNGIQNADEFFVLFAASTVRKQDIFACLHYGLPPILKDGVAPSLTKGQRGGEIRSALIKKFQNIF